jgi:hypothetical protein
LENLQQLSTSIITMSDETKKFSSIAGTQDVDPAAICGGTDRLITELLERTKGGGGVLVGDRPNRPPNATEHAAHYAAKRAEGLEWHHASWIVNPEASDPVARGLDFQQGITQLVTLLARLDPNHDPSCPIDHKDLGILMSGAFKGEWDVLKSTIQKLPADLKVVVIVGNLHALNSDVVIEPATQMECHTAAKKFIDVLTGFLFGPEKRDNFVVFYTEESDEERKSLAGSPHTPLGEPIGSPVGLTPS